MNIERWTLSESRPSGRSVSLSEAISRTFGSCDCGYEMEDGEIAASFTRIDLAPLTLVRYFGRGTHWAERRVEHIRRNTSDDFLFYLPQNSRVTINQGGLTSRLSAGQIGFVNTRHAYRGQLEGTGAGDFESTHVVVPGAILRSRLPSIDCLAGHAVEIGDSLHHIVSNYAHAVATCQSADAPLGKALGNIMLETLCAISDYAVETQLGRQVARSSATRGLDRVQTFILTHLTDPRLSVSLIAERLHVSQRYIHGLFEGTGWTVKTWIKHRRLVECQKAITSPDMKDRTLTEIAYNWGFSDFSHFSRCYKAKFGCSPREDRVALQ